MPIYSIEAPDGKTYSIEGPPGATREQVIMAIQARMAERQEKPKAEPETGFVAGVKSGFQRLGGDLAALGAAAGVEGAEEKAKELRDKAAQTYRQPGFTEKPVDYVTGLLGQSLAYTAAPLAAGVALNPLGATAAMGAAGLASATQFTGSNLSRQMEEGTAAKDLNVGSAVGASIPQAALDVVGFRFVPGLRRIFGAAGKELTEQQAQNVMRHYMGNAAKTATVEGLTEAGQAVLERAQAGLNLTNPQARQEYFDNFIGGAVLGGTLSVPGTYVERGRDEARREEKAAADAEAARIKAAETAAAAAAARQQELQDPKVALDVADRFEALKQQEKELLIARKQKPPKDADDEAKLVHQVKVVKINEKLQELRSQLQELAPDYKAVKPRLAEYRERQRVETMSPEDVFNERLDAQAAEWSKGQPAAKPIKEEPYTLDSWLDQTANTPAPAAQVAPDQQQLDLDAALEGLRYHDILTPSDVAQVVSNDLGLVKRLYDGTVSVPEFNSQENRELRDALKLQLNTLKDNRKEVESIQKMVDAETAALQRIGQNPNPEITSTTQLGLTNELQNLADAMKPGASVEEGLQKQNYRAKAEELRKEASAALGAITESTFDLEKGNTLDSKFAANRKLASSTTDSLRNRIESEKPRYVDAVMNEVANLRAATNQQPLSPDQVRLGYAQMVSVLDAFANGQATQAALEKQLATLRDRLLNYRPQMQKGERDLLNPQYQGYEAEQVAEERGETAKTLEGQLRRQRDYVGGLIEKAIPLGSIPRNVRGMLQRAQKTIDDGTASRDVLDRAEEIASRVLRGQNAQEDLRGLDEALRTLAQAQRETSKPGQFNEADAQLDLFGEREAGGKGGLGFIRQTPTNLQKFLDSRAALKLRGFMRRVRKAAGSKDAAPGVDSDFYAKRVEALEKEIADAKTELEKIGDASWQSLMKTMALRNKQKRATPELAAARQKLYALLQDKNRLEMEEAVRLRKQRSEVGQKDAGKKLDEAKKLRTQLTDKNTALLKAVGDLVKKLRREDLDAAYGPLIEDFEQQADAIDKELASLTKDLVATPTMAEDADANTDAAIAELRKLQAELLDTRSIIDDLYFAKTGQPRNKVYFSPAALESARDTLARRKAELTAARNAQGMSAKSLGRLEAAVAKAELEVEEQERLRTKFNEQERKIEQWRDLSNYGLMAIADERIAQERANLKSLEKQLESIDLVGEERTRIAQKAAAMRRAIAVVDKKLSAEKEAQRKQAEAMKMRVATGEGTLKTRRTVEAVERENPKTGEKVILMEKGTDNPVLQKKTEGAYVDRTPVKGVDWKSRKKAKPTTKADRLSLESDEDIKADYRERIRNAVAGGDTKLADKLRAELRALVTPDEPIVAKKQGAFENLQDFAKVAGTLSRQSTVTDIAPRPDMKGRLRTGGERTVAETFAKNDAGVQAVKKQFGATSEQYKKALRNAVETYGAKLAGKDFTVKPSSDAAPTGKKGAQLPAGMSEDAYNKAIAAAAKKSGAAYRVGDTVEMPVDTAQAKAFIDKVKAALPKGVKLVYVNDLQSAPDALIQAIANDGLVDQAGQVKGAVLPDGTVVIIGSHHSSMVDLEKTVVHELAHYGTDTLLGKDGMNALYKALEKNDGGIMAVARDLGVDDDVQEVALEYGRRYEAAQARGASKEELAAIKEAGQQQALREMLAHVAEAKVDKTLLQKAGDFIKATIGAVRAALRKMGFAELAKASTSDIFYVLRQAHTGVYNGTLAAYQSPNGETVFRRGQAAYASSANPAFAAFNAKTGVGKAEAPNKVFSAATGIGFKTAMVDRFAPLKAVAEYMKNSAQAMQMMYYARMHDQRMAFTATTATNGARTIAQDEKGNYIIKEAGTASLKDVSDTLAKVKGLGNAAAVRDSFDAYLKAYRAKRVGGKVLNFDNPPTAAEIQATIDAGDAIPEFVKAREQYNDYNRGLINWLVQSGAISKKLGKELSSTNDYVPFYRVENDNVLFEIGDRAPITIGDLKNQPYLQELVGGKEDTKDFFTAALQNTAMLTDMGLRNLATKETAFALQSAGLLGGVVNEKTGKTRGIFKGPGPASDKIIRFKIDGETYHAVVDTDAIGVPADVLVQGMHGTVTQMGGFVKMMAVPARFMRAMITRNPVYSVRQIVRDSTSNFLLTGGNTTPVISALSELGKMWQGKSTAEKQLQERGVLGGQIISGTSEDMQKILLQLVSGKPGWETALAKLDSIAMKSDASSRVALYNSFRKQGLSDMEATLAALEAMNFSKRGTSGTLYKLNMMVPFLNAQIQGLNVLWEAFTGKLPYAQALKQKQKFYTRAAMLGASTLMYAAMMSDDEAYKNASLRDRLQNWLVKVPGLDDPIKVPIPFEAGLIFKALPEALALMSQKDEESKEVLKALGGMVAMSTPVGVSTQPQAIKPLIEAYLGKSFFTGRDIESASEQELMPSERVRGGTSELAKMVSAATGGTVSPIMVEHFVNGYTGGMGLAIMQSANAILPADTAAPTKRVSEMPIIGALFQPRDAQGQITAMYERAKRYEQVKNSFDKMLEEGRGADAQALAQRYAKEIVFAEIAEDFKKDLGEFSAMEKQIRASALSPDEKRARLDEVRQAKIAMAKAFNAAALRE